MKPGTEVRDGRIWCLKHDRPWRKCPCPGDAAVRFFITREMLEAIRPDGHAFERATESLLGGGTD